MIYISHEYQAIYIHIPKCGGCYTRNILKKYYNFKSFNIKNNNHKDFCDDTKNFDMENFFCVSINKKGVLRYFYENSQFNKFMQMDSEKWKTYYKFTFVRCPYKKVVSGYQYMKRSKIYRNDKILDETEYYKDFSSFVRNRDKISNIGFFHAFITQYDHLLDNNDELKLNYIGNADNLSYELTKVLKNIGVKEIKHIEEYNDRQNVSIDEIPFYKHYDEETLLKINDLFDIDFKIFGFNKISDINEFNQIYSSEKEKDPFIINFKDILKNDAYTFKCIQKSLENNANELNRLIKIFFENIEIIHNIKKDDFSYNTHKQAINSLVSKNINLTLELKNISKINQYIENHCEINIETNIV